MLEPVLGSSTKEKALLFLYCKEEGYAREMARFFRSDLSPLQRQLEKMESAGVLYSRLVGRTRLYGFNPRYPFLPELKAILKKALAFAPEDLREALTLGRRRPRKAGKPL